MSSLGERVKVLRLNLGLSQPQLAKLVGIKQPSLSYIENNPSKEIKQETLLTLAKHLKTTPQWLSTGEGDFNDSARKPNVNSLGQRIKITRESKGLSQEELAIKVDATQRTISRYETDVVERPSINIITSIANALDVSSQYLMHGLGDNPFSDDIVEIDLIKTIQSLTNTNQAILLEVAKTLKRHQRPPEENETLQKIKKMLAEN